jgi:hypothetical protein
LSLTGHGNAEFLSVVLFGVIVGVFLQGFVSWTLLDPERTPMALWFLALLTAETCRRRAAISPTAADATDESLDLEKVING